MSKNVVEPERPQMTIWRMRVACWISKVTSTKAQARAHAPTSPLAPTHTHTHTHTQICNIYCGMSKVSQCYVIRTLPVSSVAEMISVPYERYNCRRKFTIIFPDAPLPDRKQFTKTWKGLEQQVLLWTAGEQAEDMCSVERERVYGVCVGSTGDSICIRHELEMQQNFCVFMCTSI
jgi:hypothetical protein